MATSGCILPHAESPYDRDRYVPSNTDGTVVVSDQSEIIEDVPVFADNPNPRIDSPNPIIDVPNVSVDVPNPPVDVPNVTPDVPNVRPDVPNVRPDVPNVVIDVPSVPVCGSEGEVCCMGAGPGIDADGCRNGVNCWPLSRRCECGGIGQRSCNGNRCDPGATLRDINGENFCVSNQGAGGEQNGCRGSDPACNAGLTCRDFGANFCVNTCGLRNQPCCLARYCAAGNGSCRAAAGSTYGICQ